jgi:SAM-dependent methyltransferase
VSITGVLIQQVQEPEHEHQLRASIPALTVIDDRVSLAVKEQYEQNPYPRWVKPAPPVRPLTINQFLQSEFPLAHFCAREEKSDNIDILVAGCGTGQEAIETAQRFSQARVLAIDLSVASLAYGARKTRELGIERVVYAQADILKLGSLDQSFEMIVASGVLHHLADPLWDGGCCSDCCSLWESCGSGFTASSRAPTSKRHGPSSRNAVTGQPPTT